MAPKRLDITNRSIRNQKSLLQGAALAVSQVLPLVLEIDNVYLKLVFQWVIRSLACHQAVGPSCRGGKEGQGDFDNGQASHLPFYRDCLLRFSVGIDR